MKRMGCRGDSTIPFFTYLLFSLSVNDAGAKWIENFPFSFKLSLSMDAARTAHRSQSQDKF